jgi:5-methylcytosine-specific restriction endonuclease McrA
MRHRSKKKEAEYRLRRPLVARLLEQRPHCEACPVFAEHDEKVVYSRRRSVDIHELKRRSQGGSILDEDNLMAVCRECHDRIGRYPALAFELGLSRHGWEE